ncbi:MAG: DNA polymerase III subunit delta [Bacteroidetes bacterium]|nr:DNA polymerase III subunit delta [Bacteroidota bacterium]
MAKKKERLDSDPFIASFKKGEFAPCYLFSGEERYPVDLVVDALIEQAVEPSMREFNLDMVHGSEIDGKKIVSLASAYPMMADRRVVVVKDFDKVNGKDALDAYVEQPSASTVLVLIANNPDYRKKPFAALKKAGYAHESRTWYDNETIGWLDARVKKMRRSIEPAAVRMLFSYVGNNLRELVNELEKVTVAYHDVPTITAAHVEKVVGVSREYSAFQLCDKVGEKNIAKALEIAQRMIGSGESVVGLIAALTNHFIRLWKLKEAVGKGESDQKLLSYVFFNQFALNESKAQLPNFTPAEIEGVFVLLAEADLAAKSSGDPRMIITTLIAEIISGAGRRAGTAAVR